MARRAPKQHNNKKSVPKRQLELSIDNFNSEGQGVARKGRDVFFIPGALPGEQVMATLVDRRKKVLYAQLDQVNQASEQREEPLCAHYQTCGGCDLQHLNYPGQVSFKQARVEREFQRQHIEVAEWVTPIQADAWGYRRKARLGVRYNRDKDQVFIGFREEASSHLTDIQHCVVLPEHPMLDWSAWRELIASLDCRSWLTQIEVLWVDNALAMVVRLLKPLAQDDQRRLFAFFEQHQAHDDERELQLWIRTEKGAEARCIWPAEPVQLMHRVDDLALDVKPEYFIQVNKKVNQQMVQQALDWLSPSPTECIWDLFAGHGNFSMPLAKQAANILAVEVHEGMVSSLEKQAEKLALPLQAVKADLSLEGSLNHLPKADALLLDPPRAGAWEVVNQLVNKKISRVLYISCDVATLARDIKKLCESGYQVQKAGIMDMFPQTHHVESMVLLEYRGS